MKKIVMFMVLMMCFVTGCSTNKRVANNSSNVYSIENAAFKSGSINIDYPQIKFSDLKQEDKINQLIKHEILKYLPNYKNEEVEIRYDVMLKSSNILSIWYHGTECDSSDPHPYSVVYTTNIDIDKCSVIQARDIIDIKDTFVSELLNKAEYKYGCDDIVKDNQKVLNKVLSTDFGTYYTADGSPLLEQFLKNAVFYLTKDSFGFPIYVPHEVGDNAEFEVKYQDIKDSLKVNYEDLLQGRLKYISTEDGDNIDTTENESVDADNPDRELDTTTDSFSYTVDSYIIDETQEKDSYRGLLYLGEPKSDVKKKLIKTGYEILSEDIQNTRGHIGTKNVNIYFDDQDNLVSVEVYPDDINTECMTFEGLRYGDDVNKVTELYGKPDSIEYFDEINGVRYTYNKPDNKFVVCFNSDKVVGWEINK